MQSFNHDMSSHARVLAGLLMVACHGGATDAEYGAQVEAPRDTDVTIIPGSGVAADVRQYIEPVAVGFEFDGAITNDGEITGFFDMDQYFEPYIFVTFASEAFFAPLDEDTDAVEYCLAWGPWNLERISIIDTIDDEFMFYDYDGVFEVAGHDCGDLMDPQRHGEDAADFIDQFDGMRLGWGFGPMSPSLLDGWSSQVLDTWDTTMFASYVAVSDADESFIAEDISTCFAFEIDGFTGDLLTDSDGFLLPMYVSDLEWYDGLPDLYAVTSATYYWRLEDLDLGSLK
jgi:hypothetical protein